MKSFLFSPTSGNKDREREKVTGRIKSWTAKSKADFKVCK